MKVLRIISTMDPKSGGVAEAVRSIAVEFSKGEDQMDVVCFDDQSVSWVQNDVGFTVYGLGKGVTSYAFHCNYLFWLWKHACDYDVVIIDGLWQFHVIGGYLLRIMGIRYFVFTHGMLDPYFNKSRLKFVKKLPFWFFVERNVLALAESALFTCEEESRLATRSFPFYCADHRVVTLGVERNSKFKDDLSAKFYGKFPLLNKKRFILFLSRIHPKKGIDLLIEAIGTLKSLPDDFYIVIAGPDNVGTKDDLSTLAKELGVDDCILWVGMLNGDDKWGAYNAAEAFVLPSHQENFGIVVAEALSCGTPVLISDKVNIWREISAYNAGIVAPDTVEGTRSLLDGWD